MPSYCSDDYGGICEVRPTDCSSEPDDEVCECRDGTRHRNECEARRSGYEQLLVDCEEDCPEPGSFTFELEWDPVPGSFTNFSSGTVVGVLEDPPGTLAISVDLLSGDHAPGIHDFRVPLPEGAGIDLSVDDAVTVSTNDLTACLGCSIRELSIEREGEVVLYALDCENEICNESEFTVGPLQLSTVTGRCEPWRDPDDDSWCYVKEHGGLEVGCAGGTAQELFRGQQTTVDCGSVYHVSAGFLIRVVEDRHMCADYPENLRQILVIRDGDGLSDPGGGG